MARDLLHRAAFESHGETRVRVLAQQNDEVGREANAWLAEQQALKDDAIAAKRDAREEETLSIAKKSTKIAARAEKWAMCAAIAAVVALVISLIPKF